MFSFIEIIREIYRNRELVYNLAAKDFKVRYKTATLGFLWSLLNPLLLMIILSVVFSLIMKIQIEKYPVFLLTALIPWNFFSLSVTASTNSLIDNANLIKKIYFPRELIPISINLANLIHFLLTLIVLFAFLLVYNVKFTAYILLLPLVILLHVTLNIGVSFITSSLQARYRDVKFIVDVLIMLGFYATPIFYPISMVPDWFLPIYMLNPMVGIVGLYRDILLYGHFPELAILLSTIILTVGFLIIGFSIFRKYRCLFADYV